MQRVNLYKGECIHFGIAAANVTHKCNTTMKICGELLVTCTKLGICWGRPAPASCLPALNNYFEGFQFLTAVVIFWDITPCSPLRVNRGGTCRLHLQGRRIRQARNQSEPASFACYTLYTSLLIIVIDWSNNNSLWFLKRWGISWPAKKILSCQPASLNWINCKQNFLIRYVFFLAFIPQC
jgi:hypothetical protein